MRRFLLRLSVLFFSSLCFYGPQQSQAQTAEAVQHSARVLAAVDASQTVRMSGHVPAFADVDLLPSTAIDPTAKFAHLTVVLSRSADVEAAFEQLLADQVNPSSARYHQWLTPGQVGALYGPAQSDVDAVTGWLQSQGLTVNSVSPNRLFVDFSGPVASVESAFGTSFRIFSLANGDTRYSLTREPAIPAAVRPVVATVAGLSETIHHSTAHRGELVTPKAGAGGELPALNSSSGNHYLLSGDFAVAYDMNSVYSAGISGTGQNIAVAGLARVNPADISTLETLEGLATKQANVIIPTTGVDPGAAATTAGSDNGNQDEATLDVDRTISTAPGATVDLVVSGSTGSGNTYATDGLYIAINYAISTMNDPILTVSFGGCEYLNGQANDTYEQTLFQTAASQGITTFVSSGDSGAAACNAFYTTIPSAQVLSINDLCANQYVTCVGGTEFADSTNASTYWSSSNGTNYVSLLSYIPEGAWNDVSVSTSNVYSQGATGGGTSIYIPRPSWQVGTGVLPGSFRLIPDVALTSSTHDGFVTCLAYLGATCGSFYSFGGTSAAAPSMAGIQALVNQKLGGRQGNVNPNIYALANSTSYPYHDVTVASSGVTSCSAATPSLCNNSTPAGTSLAGGQAGYLVTAGWDADTGWGSVDVAKYVAAVASLSSFTLTPASPLMTVAAGASNPNVLTLTSKNNFAGTVALSCAVYAASGTATGSCSVTPSATLAAGGTATGTLTTVANTGTSGTFNVIVTATSGTATSYATIVVTVASSTAAAFSVTPFASNLSFTSGSTSGNLDNLVFTSLSGYAGTLVLTCSVSTGTAYYQPTCSVSPSSVSLTAGGQTSAALTIGSTTAVTAAVDGSATPLGWRLGSGATLALLLFCTPLRKRRRAVATLTLAALLGLGLSGVTGCSDHTTAVATTTTTGTTRSSAGTYTVTVTAAGTATVSTAIAVTIK